MRTRIVRIGNSQGVRIPKPLLEQAGLGEDVELRLEGDAIVLRPARTAREGWAEAFRTMAEEGEGELLDPPVATRFDEEEWTW